MIDAQEWERILKTISPRAKPSIVLGLFACLDEVLDRYAISTPQRRAHFLAQLAHESAGFTTLKEIGGPAYFARYNNRRDLGNGPNDGPIYYGRGLIQLTGRANYREYGKKLGLPLEQKPNLVLDPEVSLKVACEYWKSKRLNTYADSDDIRTITKRINGGYNGLEDRIKKLRLAKKALGIGGNIVSLMSVDDDLEPEVAVEPEEGALTKDQIYQVQCRLRTLHYYDVGDADGDMGRFTQTAIYAFKLDNGIEPQNSEITPEFLQALTLAGPRPVSEQRATATAQEVADKGVSEVKASMSARLWSGAQTGVATVAATAATVKATVGDTLDSVSPYRTIIVKALSSIPPSLVAVVLFGIAGTSALVWYKANRATNKATEAYQKGARK